MQLKGAIPAALFEKMSIALGSPFHYITRPPDDPGAKFQARSSVVEHYLDMVGVGSSTLPAPTNTIIIKALAIIR